MAVFCHFTESSLCYSRLQNLQWYKNCNKQPMGCDAQMAGQLYKQVDLQTQ